jgi:uncharacterized protein YbjT (DUF2867 family)
MENFLSTWLLPGIQAGKVVMGIDPDCWIQMISIRDIGEYVLAAFRTPDWYLRQTIEIAGDELTIPDALGMISQATGIAIGYERLPDDRLEAAVGSDMARMFRWFNKGGSPVDVPALVKNWEIPLTQFRDFVRGTTWPLSTARRAA